MLKHIFLPLLVLSVGLVQGQDCPSPYGPPTDEGYTTVNAAYFDTDGNGVVGLTDMMNLLSVYGVVIAPSFPCGDPLSYQGYDYATVLIGEQCWFAENLRNENYENGEAIPSNLSDSDWSSTTSGAVAVYGEGSSDCYNYSPDGDACDEAWSLNEYGRLYNWYAVDDARGLCPSDWHVPTDGEWTVMTDHLGGESAAGGPMKSDYGWKDGGNGTNTSGFSGLPGGVRSSSGYFEGAGYGGFWWSSSPDGPFALGRILFYDLELVDRYSGLNQRFGFSVRCVRDAE